MPSAWIGEREREKERARRRGREKERKREGETTTETQKYTDSARGYAAFSCSRVTTLGHLSVIRQPNKRLAISTIFGLPYKGLAKQELFRKPDTRLPFERTVRDKTHVHTSASAVDSSTVVQQYSVTQRLFVDGSFHSRMGPTHRAVPQQKVIVFPAFACIGPAKSEVVSILRSSSEQSMVYNPFTNLPRAIPTWTTVCSVSHTVAPEQAATT